MESFTPISGLVGGILIGCAAALLLWLNGQIAGVSGVIGGLVRPRGEDAAWRALFATGLVVGVLIYRLAGGPVQAIDITGSVPVLVAGGLLVGFGTQMGNGCTSGHGVCGIARFSIRSITATVTFIAAAVATVFIVRHVAGT